MTKADPARKPLRQDELVERLKTGRVFQGVAITSEVTLDELDLSESRFEDCAFDLPNVRGADFSGAQFKECRFSPVRLASCKFAGARFEGAGFFDPESKKGAVFAFCDLREVEAEKCNFAVGAFERCDLHDFKARECSFRGVRFNGSSFAKAISRRVVVTRARFEACNFTFTDFAGCKFVDTAFFDVDLTDAILRGCSIEKAEWERANLTRADLRGSTISGLNLAVLSGYAGLAIGESQQTELLERLGVSVSPD